MTTPKKPAKAVPVKKPAAPLVAAKSDAPDAATYRVTGRINRDGEILRPANPATGRKADTVELTESEAYDLRGFVEPATAEDLADAEPTE
jgi:hypothetical protein